MTYITPEQMARYAIQARDLYHTTALSSDQRTSPTKNIPQQDLIAQDSNKKTRDSKK